MPKLSRLLALAGLMLASGTAQAAARADFGSIPICASLRAMPRGYQAVDCNRAAPLRECTFRLPTDQMPVHYLIEGGKLLQKAVAFQPGRAIRAPFGLTAADTIQTAERKLRLATGLTFETWDDEADSEGGRYLQSADVTCPGNSYNVRAFFSKAGRITEVSVSSLPMT